MGKEGQYDLRLADSVSALVTPDTDTEDDISLCELPLNGVSHPTKLLKYACAKMLKIISISLGQHANKMDRTSVANVAAMFRSILTARMGSLNLGLEHWTTLGFLRAISTARNFSQFLTRPTWIDLHIHILMEPTRCEQDVYKKVQSLRLLQATLVNWQSTDDVGGSAAATATAAEFIGRIFHVLGSIVMYCPNDVSLMQQTLSDVKARVLLAASHSGTIAEEIIALLRKLHTLPLWNGPINGFLAQKLCMATDLLSWRAMQQMQQQQQPLPQQQEVNEEKASVVAALNVIGGCDPRPRIGMNLTHEGQRGTITTFTYKGKSMVCIHNTTEVKRISVAVAKESADIGAFSLSRLPLNEMLLNSWSILLNGPGEWKPLPVGGVCVDENLLRSQQIHLASLNATCVLFRHQSSLRKIMRQRSPTTGLSRRFATSEQSLSDDNHTAAAAAAAGALADDDENNENVSPDESNNNDDNTSSDDDLAGSGGHHQPHDLLIQTMLERATLTNPLKAHYTYAEMAMAALNVSQLLASHIHSETNGSAVALTAAARPMPPPVQSATLIHGEPIYNDSV